MATERDELGKNPGKYSLQVMSMLVWPITLAIVAIVGMLIYRGSSTLNAIELGPKGLKIAFNLLEATERGGPSGVAPQAPPDLKKIQDLASKTSKLSLAGAKVLWVDDDARNQSYERSALEVLGIEFVLAEDTTEALALLKSQEFSAVITDFHRVEAPRAGYTLLEDVRSIDQTLPVIIYSSSVTSKMEAEAIEHGAFGETDSPQRLFELTIQAIYKSAKGA